MTDNTYEKDTLSEQIGVLARREAEARILIPVIEALGGAFGPDKVKEIVAQVIIDIARDQGQKLAAARGDNSLETFMDCLSLWTRDNALELEIRHRDEDCLAFDVTRCRYAEMYKALGAADLGEVFSCNRDFALMQGFNPKVHLERARTIMKGDPVCTFCYTLNKDDAGSH